MILCVVAFILRKNNDIDTVEVSKKTSASSEAPVFRKVPEPEPRSPEPASSTPTQFRKVGSDVGTGPKTPPPPPIDPFS
jgi:hypothetical protein